MPMILPSRYFAVYDEDNREYEIVYAPPADGYGGQVMGQDGLVVDVMTAVAAQDTVEVVMNAQGVAASLDDPLAACLTMYRAMNRAGRGAALAGDAPDISGFLDVPDGAVS